VRNRRRQGLGWKLREEGPGRGDREATGTYYDRLVFSVFFVVFFSSLNFCFPHFLSLVLSLFFISRSTPTFVHAVAHRPLQTKPARRAGPPRVQNLRAAAFDAHGLALFYGLKNSLFPTIYIYYGKFCSEFSSLPRTKIW